MWCSNAVKRTVLFKRATSRTPSRPVDAQLFRLWVRDAGFLLTFPLATPLPSTTSAGSSPLFGGFLGTTGVSDFSSAWTTGLRLLALPVPPEACASGTDEISQLLCRSLPGMLRVSDRAGSGHDWRVTPCPVLPSEIL